MSVTCFYNLYLTPVSVTEVESDILSGVRRGYFERFSHIRDRIMCSSDSDAISYDFSIEKGKVMRWVVTDASGYALEEVTPAEDGRYFICIYRNARLCRRLLFSKLHTLLKVECYSDTGEPLAAIEPRKAKEELCLMMKAVSSADPVVLFAHPEIDHSIRQAVADRFCGSCAVASTDEGVVLFLPDEVREELRLFLEALEQDTRTEEQELSGTPLADRLNAKDFNVKRNLSSSLDITMAKDFDYTMHDEEAEPMAEELNVLQTEQPDMIPPIDEIVDTINAAVTPEHEPEAVPSVNAPDKVIESDGELYSYYGQLDLHGNRSGYGRTVTPDGRTAYEGGYQDDLRSGVGTYFYKDGSLCYVGDWRENLRSGVGVGVSSRDGSIHTGLWRDNKPSGDGVRMGADGAVRFVCKELKDGSTVLFNFMPDDSVVIAKYDPSGRKIGEDSISLLDFLADRL